MMTGKKRLVDHRWTTVLALMAVLGGGAVAWAGPYSQAGNDPTNPYDAPIPGFVGPNGDGDTTAGNYVNPAFLGWATGFVDYLPTSLGFDHWENEGADWAQPSRALGPVTGDPLANTDVVSLGELYDPGNLPPPYWVPEPDLIGSHDPGEITLTFSVPIRNGVGPDFAVFENGFVSDIGGDIFAELAYVDVSSDGVKFARFAGDSQNPGPVPAQGSINPTNVHNLAGKHSNGYTQSWGTPFDLGELADHDLVTTGVLDLQAVTHVRLVDIPGNGYYTDADGDPIYDAWATMGSGGFDLDAVGVLNEEWPDFDGDGDVDADDIDLLSAEVRAPSPDLCYDLNNDGIVDGDDLTTMVETCVETTVGRGTALGDFNLDGLINATDLAIMKVNYARTDAGWAYGNANTDQVVNATDVAVFKTYSGFDATAGGAVPEPATLGLLAVGAAAGLARRHRRSK